MTEERKIKAALKVDASQIQLPADLLQRINRQAGSLAPVRPSRWSKLWLWPKLQPVTACILLVGLLGFVAVRNLSSGQAPAGGDQGSGIQGTAPETPPPQGLPPTSDVTKDDFSLAGITLGDSADQVKKVLGDPDEVTVAKGLGTPVWRYSKQGIEIGFRQDGGNAGPVNSVAAGKGFTGPTHRGIQLGATETDVVKAYGPVLINKLNNGGHAEITDGDKSIQFSFTAGAVTHIIMQPSNSTSEAPTLKGLPLASDVTKAYFVGYPGAGERSLDQSVVAKVLGWLKDAQFVGEENATHRHRETDFHLVMELRNGGRLMVRLAEDCIVTKTADSTPTTCHRAEGLVNLITTTGEANRLRAPELEDWLLGQAAHPAPPPPQSTTGSVTEGAGDLTLGGMQATFSAPSSPTKITEEQARETAIKHIGQPPADAKVSVEYVLLTLPGPPVLNGKKMEAYPVYLVTYDGIKVIPTGGVPQTTQGAAVNMDTPSAGAQDTKGKITALIDANDGEWIMGVAR